MRKRRIEKFILTATIAFLFTPRLAHAESALKWEDEAGRVFYGSKPPPGAKNVKGVDAKSYSRYSSERMLRPYRIRNTPKESNLSLPSKAVPEKPPSEMKEEPKTPEAPSTGESGGLTAGEPTIERNEAGEISACRITVTNPTDRVIQAVLVAFEFDDGTWLPTNGLEEIPAKGEAVYTVPADQLPVRIRYSLADEKRETPKPRIIVQGRPAAG